MKKLVIIASFALIFASCGTSTEGAGKDLTPVDSAAVCSADSTACAVADSATVIVNAADSLK